MSINHPDPADRHHHLDAKCMEIRSNTKLLKLEHLPEHLNLPKCLNLN